MLRKVSLEEAFKICDLADLSEAKAALYTATANLNRCMRQIKFITDERVEISYKHGIGFAILSLTLSAGLQGVAKQDAAKKHARIIGLAKYHDSKAEVV